MVDDNDIFLIEEYEKTSHPENGMFSISDESGILKILSEFQDYLPPLKNGEYRKSAAEKLSKYACCILLRKDYVNVGFAAIYANDKETKTGFDAMYIVYLAAAVLVAGGIVTVAKRK